MPTLRKCKFSDLRVGAILTGAQAELTTTFVRFIKVDCQHYQVSAFGAGAGKRHKISDPRLDVQEVIDDGDV